MVIRVSTIVVIAAVLFYGGGGWYFSSKLDTIALSGSARRSLKPDFSVPVEAITSALVSLQLTSSAPSEVKTPGTWGIDWPGGFGQISAIRSLNHSAVQRSFRLITGVPPRVGEKVDVTEEAFPGNPKEAFGLTYKNVSYKGPLGYYPSWLIPGTSNTWAITVHGNAMTRLDGMSAVPVLHALGLPLLMISYRNDPGAPRSKHDLLRYGQTEWLDLQAAVAYALSHGAHHVVLVGYSMGGAIVTSFLLHSALAANVPCVVLDAPLLDFSTAVNFGASQMSIPGIGVRLPQSLTDVAKWISSWRFNVQWQKLNYVSQAQKLRTPILLFQGLNDKTVPAATSALLAKDRPKLVTYVTTAGAGHLESWNLNPPRYDGYLRSFVAQHL